MNRYPSPRSGVTHPRHSCFTHLPEVLNPALRRQLADSASATLSLKRGEMLAGQGEPFRHLYLVLHGAFKLVRADRAAREQIVAFAWPRDLLGVDGFARHVHETSLVALQSSLVCEFPVATIEALAETDADLLDHLLAYVAGWLGEAERAQLMLGRMDARQKIAYFFRAVHSHAPHGGGDDTFDVPMTRAEIGNYTGMSMETTSRQISKLQSTGAIRIASRQVTICDPGILEQWIGLDRGDGLDGDATHVPG